MKVWILLVLAGLLLAWSFSRERLEPTANIRAPPYNESQQLAIYNMMSPASKQVYNRFAQGNEGRAAFFASNTVAVFYERVYRTATTPITAGTIDSFLADAPPGQLAENVAAIKDLLTAYFINQQPAPAPTPAAPAAITVVPVPIPCPVREGMAATAAPLDDA